MKFRLTFITLLLFQLSFGQNSKTEIKYGLYGIYADPSFYQELTINENGTFHFYDRVELGTSNKYQGKWKIEKNKITLFDFENNKRKPIPTTYIYEKDQLCSISKDELCFKYQYKEQTSTEHIDNIRKVFEEYINTKNQPTHKTTRT